MRSLAPGLIALLAVIVVIASGCGGHGGGLTGTTGFANGTGTGTSTTGGSSTTTGDVDPLTGPGPEQGPPVSSAVKYADINLATMKFNALVTAGATGTNRDQQLYAYFKTIRDFKQTGLSADGTVWGRFQDNTYYEFNDHDIPDGDTTPGGVGTQSLISASPASTVKHATVGSIHPAGNGPDIVDGKNALLLDVFDGTLNEPNTQIAQMLTKRGYNVDSEDATLENLRGVQDVSALYWSSHGGQADNSLLPGKKFWSVFSSTPANATNDQTFHDDLAAGRLVVFTAATHVGLLSVTTETHYAITADWVKFYTWSFSKHSLAFINCCWSDAGGFCAALRGLPTPATTTFGWSNAASPTQAWRAGAYFFDRALGTDMYSPIMPGKLRPFSASKVFAKIQSLGWDDASTSEYGPCKLAMNGSDLLLAPSIQKMTMYDLPYSTANPHAVLEIYGDFGNDPPMDVQIAGTSAPFKYVNSGEIDANPPAHESDAGYAGGVQVIGPGGTKSNNPPLTSWSGTFEYDSNPVYNIVTGKQLIEGSFRADIHKYRNDVDGDLQNPTGTYDRISTGSQDKWAIAGSVPGVVYQSPLSGTYDYGLDGTANSPWGVGYELDAKIDRAAGTFNLSFLYLGTDVEYVIPPDPQVLTYIMGADSLISSDSFTGMDKYGGELFTPKLLTTLNASDFSVPETFFKGAAYAGDFAEFTIPNLKPKYQPTTDYEEDTDTGS